MDGPPKKDEMPPPALTFVVCLKSNWLADCAAARSCASMQNPIFALMRPLVTTMRLMPISTIVESMEWRFFAGGGGAGGGGGVSPPPPPGAAPPFLADTPPPWRVFLAP